MLVYTYESTRLQVYLNVKVSVWVFFFVCSKLNKTIMPA